MKTNFKNYFVFFDNSANVESDMFIEVSAFMYKKNAIKTIKQLAEMSEVKLIVLWTKRTKIGYVYKNDLYWGENGIFVEIKKAYELKTKKTLKIKKIMEQ